ncbi:MAG: DUF4032 domain-containing protein [Candidatus Dormibacteraeota bacterium]|nr:DUF4032 domain-containing protein [Candidatus Dormibacteraeota bacterium]
MAATYQLALRPQWPGLIDLDWSRPLERWPASTFVDLPRGISRHTVRFLEVDGSPFALKELPQRAAERDYAGLRRLEDLGGSAVRAVGVVTREGDPDQETAAVLITRYADYSFSYRELLSGEGFGERRTQLLDAFAFLLVELHLLGCFWGDCSLSNTLYRYDAGAIETMLVDAETSELHDELSRGQREYDLEIMRLNVGGEMADIAASRGLPLDDADLALGDDIARRYEALWKELASDQRLPADAAQYKVEERVERLNDLGFEVDGVTVEPAPDRGQIRLGVRVADRHFHTNRLRALTGVEASEHQARQILSDLSYYEMKKTAGGPRRSPAGKALIAARWRVEEFEPWLKRLAEHLPPGADPVQAYTDVLHHRYMLSVGAGRDVGTEAAFRRWLVEGRPGYPLPAPPEVRVARS